MLENRTKDSKMEMEVLENLQELKELNQRQARVDFEGMIEQYRELEKVEKKREKEEDEQETKWVRPIWRSSFCQVLVWACPILPQRDVEACPREKT